MFIIVIILLLFILCEKKLNKFALYRVTSTTTTTLKGMLCWFRWLRLYSVQCHYYSIQNAFFMMSLINFL